MSQSQLRGTDLPLGVVLDRVGRRVPGLIGTLCFAASAAIAAYNSTALLPAGEIRLPASRASRARWSAVA